MYELRASQASNWIRCPARGTYEMLNPRRGSDGKVSAAQAFGNRVHTAITGHTTDPPKTVMYDRVTATQRDLDRQSETAISRVREWLSEKGYRIEQTEVPLSSLASIAGVGVNVRGTVDILAKDGDGDRHLIDIKTGPIRPRREHMVQMAIYAWLGRQQGLEPKFLTVLAVARAAPQTRDFGKVAGYRWEVEDLCGTVPGLLRQFVTGTFSPAAIPHDAVCAHCMNVGCVYNTGGHSNG